jgi:hypothetical protein
MWGPPSPPPLPAVSQPSSTMGGAEIGLLKELQGLLHGGEAALVVGELDDGEVLDGGEVRAAESGEVARFHLTGSHGGHRGLPEDRGEKPGTRKTISAFPRWFSVWNLLQAATVSTSPSLSTR